MAWQVAEEFGWAGAPSWDPPRTSDDGGHTSHRGLLGLALGTTKSRTSGAWSGARQPHTRNLKTGPETYDAKYVALARMLDCRLVTLDGKLRDGAKRLGFVVTPAEL